MASPAGHAIVGLAAAAVVQHATGAEATPALWIGAFIASGVPDLDFLSRLVGKTGPRYHRNVSHSMLVLAAGWALVAAVALASNLGLSSGTLLAWLVALWSHPILDYLTTGPKLARDGYGIALWWPLTTTRYYSKRLWLARDRPETRDPFQFVPQAFEELVRIGPLAVGAVLLAWIVG